MTMPVLLYACVAYQKDVMFSQSPFNFCAKSFCLFGDVKAERIYERKSSCIFLQKKNYNISVIKIKNMCSFKVLVLSGVFAKMYLLCSHLSPLYPGAHA